MRPQMRLFTTLVAAIPAAVHLDQVCIQFSIARMTTKAKVPDLIEIRQNQLALMMAQMACVAKQNDVFNFVAAAFALRLNVMILETAMVILLRQRRASANAAPQTTAQVGLKTRPIFEAHCLVIYREEREGENGEQKSK